MEADGITRFYLLKDEFMGESLRQIYPVPGEDIGSQERRDVIDRADIMYTEGGIIWGERPQTLMIKTVSTLIKKRLRLLAPLQK